MAKPPKKTKALPSMQSLNSFVKTICDVMRRSNCASALQYVPELTWILFLRILDQHDASEREAAEMVGRDFVPALDAPYRWCDWAMPFDASSTLADGRHPGWKRQALFDAGAGELFAFVNTALLPHLRKLVTVRNNGAAPAAVFPPTGGTINGGTVTTGSITVTNAKAADLICVDTIGLTWITLAGA